jgi:hypothetical protein
MVLENFSSKKFVAPEKVLVANESWMREMPARVLVNINLFSLFGGDTSPAQP